MGQEAVLRQWQEYPVDYTVADGIGLEKGALLQLLDERVASGGHGAAAMIAGIAAREKVAGDGRTQLAVYRKGIFDMYVSGAVALGSWVVSDTAANFVKVATGADTASGAILIGTALGTGTTGEVVQISVNIGA